MGLGKTFTNSLVREIGRNYGKAASNYLLGDKHSTPIRMVGGQEEGYIKIILIKLYRSLRSRVL